jgi:hypothetical protein
MSTCSKIDAHSASSDHAIPRRRLAPPLARQLIRAMLGQASARDPGVGTPSAATACAVPFTATASASLDSSIRSQRTATHVSSTSVAFERHRRQIDRLDRRVGGKVGFCRRDR